MQKFNKSRLYKFVKNKSTSILFVIVSIVSISYAWFAYNNQTSINFDVGIKSWNIDISRGQTSLGESFDVNIDSLVPGMDDYHDTITISNTGDVTAKFSFTVTDLRIFNQTYSINSQADLEALSQNYPWLISMYADSDYLEPNHTINFNLLISWPMDSLDNSLDTDYGMAAYSFIQSERALQQSDPTYEIRSCMSFKINFNIEQYFSSDLNVNDDDFVFSSAINRTAAGGECSGSNCIAYYLLQATKKSDSTIVAMKSLSDTNAATSANNINTKLLLSLLSRDLYNTKMVIPGASDRIVGYLTDDTLLQNALNKVANNGGYFSFAASSYYYLAPSTCYLTSLRYGNDATKYYAIIARSDHLELYGEVPSSCSNTEQVTLNK